MASRRDELNAYSFARKRTVASFLRPLPNGSVESAPRPLRTVLPTIILAMLIVAGFGACGIIKPSAPKGWDTPGEKVIVGDKSTTRYVVLERKDENGKTQKLLHPVLNLASAKLLLEPSKFGVVKVKESLLDSGKIQKGPTIGIPYAPDRLPSAEDAKDKKTWAFCERPGGENKEESQQAVFVMNSSDSNFETLTGSNKLNNKKSLYVQDEEGQDYLVDDRGLAHPLQALFVEQTQGLTIPEATLRKGEGLLRRILFGQSAQPQKVSEKWMSTVQVSPLPIFLPPVPDIGQDSQAPVPSEHKQVGRVLETDDDGDTQRYVVLKERLAPITDFVAELLLEGAANNLSGDFPDAVHVGQADVEPSQEGFLEEVNGERVPWPTEESTLANDLEDPEGKHVICTAYHGGERMIAGESLGVPDMMTWAGTEYPAPITEGGRGAYVSPGSGLLYKQVTGNAKDGSLYLVADTGLRYAVPVNNDSDKSAGKADAEQNQAQIRLGYKSIASPVTVPKEWSELLSSGPPLSTSAAEQPQVI